MDGNGRWAKERGQDRIFGHAHGVESVRESVRFAVQEGIEYLTLYAFSTENWTRPQEEVDALMNLLVQSLAGEVEELSSQGVRLQAIGEIKSLPESCRNALEEVQEKTAGGEKMTLILALSYSGRWDITQAVRSILASDVALESIDEELISKHLCGSEYPDPDLIIRTSGEQRLSNFLLWQSAHSEFHFSPVMWPDFKEAHFLAAINEFRSRERRFGKTGEQITSSKDESS